jgi:NAD-dependent dihydropyrimidine dehydrogenase PreA subunit
MHTRSGDTVDHTHEHVLIVVNYDRCSYCGACVAVCPPDSIILHDATLLIDHETCTRCRRCLPACPTGALTLEAEA